MLFHPLPPFGKSTPREEVEEEGEGSRAEMRSLRALFYPRFRHSRPVTV